MLELFPKKIGNWGRLVLASMVCVCVLGGGSLFLTPLYPGSCKTKPCPPLSHAISGVGGASGTAGWEKGKEKRPWGCCSVTKSCLARCDPADCSMPGFSVLHCLPDFAQTHVHRVSDAIQPSHPLSSPSPPALNLSQHQGLFQWVTSWHQVAKLLELQHQSFHWIFWVDFL